MSLRSQAHRYRYCLRSGSPTSYNLSHYLQQLGWIKTRFNWRAHFSEKNLQFNLKAAESLEFKHLLAQLVVNYCPDIMPLTFAINDENWPAVLNRIANQYYRVNGQLLDQVDDLVWILKPSLLNNGQQIKIFSQLSQLEQHYLSHDRLGGEHVLQQYLTHPHLLKGHKYSIRMFVVVTNDVGAYLYPHGYYNVALNAYQPNNYSDLSSHLTNEHLLDPESNVIQIPTQQFATFPACYQQIKTIVSATINGLRQWHPQAFIANKQRRLAIFGYDFVVDNHNRVWLIEANHAPCFPINDEHPLQKHLYDDFWQALIASFIVPIAAKQSLARIDYRAFVAV